MLKSLCMSVLFSVLLGFVGIAQDEPQPAPTEVPQVFHAWQLWLGGAFNLYDMKDFNSLISQWNLSARETAQLLGNRLGVTLRVSGKVAAIESGIAYGGGLLYRLLPILYVGAGAEFLSASSRGAVDISVNSDGVKYDADISADTIGFLGVASLDLSDVLPDRWGGSLTGIVGYYSSSARARIGVTFRGQWYQHGELVEDPELLNLATKLETALSTIGTKIALQPSLAVADNVKMVAAIGFRSLLYKDSDFNFMNLARQVDVDLSGFYGAIGLQISF